MYTELTMTERIFIVDSTGQKWATAGDIWEAWNAAQRAYREMKNLPNDAQIPPDVMTFRPQPGAVVIVFQIDQPVYPVQHQTGSVEVPQEGSEYLTGSSHLVTSTDRKTV